MEKSKRNRNQTSQRIIDALEEVIAEKGIAGVGVNRIAEKAGVSKVLIYRYFGGLDGLLVHYVKMGRLFPLYNEATLEYLKPEHEKDLARIWYKQVLHSYRLFRHFPTAYEVLKASVIDNEPMADVVSRAQDEEMSRLVDQLAFVKDVDARAISAIILGGMSYMTLLSKKDHTMLGIDLSTESGWERVEEAVKLIYTSLNRTMVESGSGTMENQPTANSMITYW
jgi:AcrR family transcriptional regulator